MKRVLYFTAAVWLSIGFAFLIEVAFANRFANSAAFLAGFIGLAVLVFAGVMRLREMLRLRKWIGVVAATLGSAIVLTVGLVVSLVAGLDGFFLDSAPEYHSQSGGLKCKAQTFGGMTTSVDRVDILILQPLPLGLERKVEHQSWIAQGNALLSLEEECSKLSSKISAGVLAK